MHIYNYSQKHKNKYAENCTFDTPIWIQTRTTHCYLPDFLVCPPSALLEVTNPKPLSAQHSPSGPPGPLAWEKLQSVNKQTVVGHRLKGGRGDHLRLIDVYVWTYVESGKSRSNHSLASALIRGETWQLSVVIWRRWIQCCHFWPASLILSIDDALLLSKFLTVSSEFTALFLMFHRTYR